MESDGEYRKTRTQTGYGKGDKKRPTNERAYRKGWDRIFNNRKRFKIASRKSVLKHV